MVAKLRKNLNICKKKQNKNNKNSHYTKIMIYIKTEKSRI